MKEISGWQKFQLCVVSYLEKLYLLVRRTVTLIKFKNHGLSTFKKMNRNPNKSQNAKLAEIFCATNQEQLHIVHFRYLIACTEYVFPFVSF